MSLISKVKKLFSSEKKEEVKYDGFFVVVDWDDTAKEYGLNNSYHKILRFVDNMKIVQQEEYNHARVKQLRDRGIFVDDITETELISKESLFKREADLVLGQLQLRRLETFPPNYFTPRGS